MKGGMEANRALIYMPLLDEGTSCWRPVQAIRLADDLYRITDSIPDDEKWLFSPGDVVRCELRDFADELGLVAVERINPG
jgi:hypothetical protein